MVAIVCLEEFLIVHMPLLNSTEHLASSRWATESIVNAISGTYTASLRIALVQLDQLGSLILTSPTPAAFSVHLSAV